MPLKSDYNHIICIMEGETKNIRFVLKIYRFVLRLLNISFCGLYYLKELLTQTPHDIAWLLAHHIYSVMLAYMYYHMKKLMTDSIDDAAISFTFSNGKNTSSFR